MNSFLEGFKVPVKLYWDSNYQIILDTQQKIRELNMEYWLQHCLGRWYWWSLLFLSIFPLFIWWKFIDRRRFLEISFFGVMISISAGILDSIGTYNLLWAYPYSLVSFLPNFFPIDYVVLPIIFMLIYQKYSGWTPYLIATTIVSSFLSLILDPIMVWINIYQPLVWQYYYSVPVFVFMVSFCKWVTMIILGRDATHGGLPRGN